MLRPRAHRLPAQASYLSGEIVLLGRLHGVPTPANELIQTTVNEMARTGTAPGSVNPADLWARI